MTKKILLIAGLFVALSASAQKIRVDISTPDGPADSHIFSLDSIQTWDKTSEKSFAATEGDCSKFDTSKIRNSVRIGRLVTFQGRSLDSNKVIFEIKYQLNQFEKLVPFKANATCTINNAVTVEQSFGSSGVLEINKPNRMGSLMKDDETVIVTLVD